MDSCNGLYRVEYAIISKTAVAVSQSPERQYAQSQRYAVHPRPLIGQGGRCLGTGSATQGKDFDSIAVQMSLCRIQIAAVCDARLRSHVADGTDRTFLQS